MKELKLIRLLVKENSKFQAEKKDNPIGRVRWLYFKDIYTKYNFLWVIWVIKNSLIYIINGLKEGKNDLFDDLEALLSLKINTDTLLKNIVQDPSGPLISLKPTIFGGFFFYKILKGFLFLSKTFFYPYIIDSSNMSDANILSKGRF